MARSFFILLALAGFFSTTVHADEPELTNKQLLEAFEQLLKPVSSDVTDLAEQVSELREQVAEAAARAAAAEEMAALAVERADAANPTSTSDAEAETDSAFDEAITEKVRQDLKALQSKANFKELTEKVSGALESRTTNQITLGARDVGKLRDGARSSVESAVRLLTAENKDLEDAWLKTFDDLIKAIENGEIGDEKPTTFDEWLNVYKVVMAAYGSAGQGTPTPPTPSPTTTPSPRTTNSPEVPTEAAVKISEEIRDPDQADAFKNNFAKNADTIVAALRKLRAAPPSSVDEYKKKTRDLFDTALRDNGRGVLIRAEWVRVYDQVILPLIKASDDLKDGTVEDWDKVVQTLILGLSKSAADLRTMLPDTATTTGESSQAGGSGSVSGTLGGISPHAARKIRRIKSRAAVKRARTQAILGY